MNTDTRIFVAGHNGMVGSAIVRELQRNGFTNLLLKSKAALDLTRQADVERFFAEARPEYIFLAAAKVGGLMANKTYRADFITINLQIQTNVIHAAYLQGVKKLLFMASSCIYPRECSQPMREEHLWSGHLEPTNSPYAVAKLAGIEMCRAYHDQHGCAFFSVVPSNLFGLYDNYHPENSHVMAALISKVHRAKAENQPAVTLWGTGTPRRELMDVEDAAKAAVFLMQHYHDADPINIGLGTDHSIRELVETVCEVIGYQGKLEFDATKPDGIARKLLDSSRAAALGWKAETNLRDGIKRAYADYLQRHF
ncbi:MAG: GDP-L-fucose synthase family protein [Prosthecobacter sp.]|uniref:GDP-L-fucose synthase family protein n=1 Tax=Prosthecobacter sp. TaxID=1965333 RepID=UPI0039013C18